MNKEKVIAWLDDLIEQASQSDKYFKERNDLYIENQQLKEEIEGFKRVEEYSKVLILTLQDRIEKTLSIIKEKVKDDYGIIDTGVVWEIENILKGGKDEF